MNAPCSKSATMPYGGTTSARHARNILTCVALGWLERGLPQIRTLEALIAFHQRFIGRVSIYDGGGAVSECL